MRIDSNLYVGIDLGGTTTTVGLVTARGDVLDSITFPTRAERGYEVVVQEIARKARDLVGGCGFDYRDVAGVGIGSPGPLDLKAGTIIFTPNLNWRDVPLREIMATLLDKPVSLDNDAVAATYGEWWVGAGESYRDVVGLTLGTGVGGGIVINGRIHRGFQGIGGHVGHMSIMAGGRLCGCGNRGCLEMYASATAIVMRTRELLTHESQSPLRALSGELTSKLVFEVAQKGDPLAQRVFDETAYHLAVGINSLMNILNPEAVIILGAVANAGDLLFRPLRSHLQKMSFPQVFQETKILRGKLGDLSGVVGAAGIACTPALLET